MARDSSYTVRQVVGTGVRIAKETINGRAKVGLAIGPLTGLLKPFGEITAERAKELFEEQIGCGMEEGPDLIYIQTFMDLEMMKIAIRAAKHYDVPVLCSMSFMGGVNAAGKKPKKAHTMMGNSVKDIVDAAVELKVDAIGINCSMGPVDALPVLREYRETTDLPLVFKPNAGKPKMGDGQAAGAEVHIETFAADVLPAVDTGATYIGGCCGSNPAYIKRLAEKIRAKLEAEG